MHNNASICHEPDNFDPATTTTTTPVPDEVLMHDDIKSTQGNVNSTAEVNEGNEEEDITAEIHNTDKETTGVYNEGGHHMEENEKQLLQQLQAEIDD
eukprot:15348353-Ditylum_brightwellii.AAC.1